MDRSAAAALARGRSFPLGATPRAGGVDLSVYAKHATAVELLLFDRADEARPARTIELDPRAHRTYHYWHAFVPDSGPWQPYAYRVRARADVSGRPALDRAAHRQSLKGFFR